ncbi:MAG TPA: hypothetical protein VF642_06790 [Propionibacteriaceae bacterium]|jgi:hypothetical protein
MVRVLSQPGPDRVDRRSRRPQAPSWVRNHRILVTLASAVLALLCVVTTFGLVSKAEQRRWETDCAARSGKVELVPRWPSNPLITETTDPVQQCVDSEGVVISRR